MTGVPLTPVGALGEGAAGRVVRARLDGPWGSLPAGTELALKRPLSPAGAARLEVEARALRSLAGPGVQALVEAGEDAEGPYLVSELVPGALLSERVLEGPLEDLEVRRIGATLAATLDRIHRTTWLHGDLAPGNVRLDGTGRPILLDFGQAGPIDERPVGRGTPAYLSPEEAGGAGKTPAAEAWSLGILLWELAAGSHPLAPDGRAQGVPEGAALAGVATPPSIRNPRVSPLLDHWIGELLQEDPHDRPPLAAVAEALATAGEDGSLASHDDPWAARNSLPLAGRESALAALADAWQQAAEGSGRTVWLVAERGLGKTRLVDEAARRLRRTASSPLAPTYLRVRCPPALEGRPTHPIRSLLRRWLRLERHAPVGPRERALLAGFLEPQRVEAVAALLAPVAGPEPVHEAALLADVLAELARTEPLLVFVDELQRAGEATIAVLRRLVEQLEGLPLLLVLGVREHELLDGSPARTLLDHARQETWIAERTERLELDLLDEGDLLELVGQVFVGQASPLRLARVLLERTEGKPSRLDALVHEALDRGLLRVHPEGGLELVGAAESLPRIEDSRLALESRLETLDGTDREWLELAAVDGTAVRAGRLARMGGGEEARAPLADSLARLVATGWLVQGAEGLTFPSNTTREVVLRSLDPGRRQALHGRIADALASGAGAGRSFERAHHLHAAGRGPELVEVALELLPAARALGHPRRVLALTEWALAADAEHSAEALLELHAAAADAAGTLGLRSTERLHLDRLVDLDLSPEEAPCSVARVYLLHGHAAADAGRAGLARGYLRNAAMLARKGGAADLGSQALRRLAEVELAAGEIGGARETARRARARAEDSLTGLHAHLVTGVAALLEDRPQRARAHALAVALRCRRSDPGVHRSEVQAGAFLLAARAWSNLARPQRALAFLERARRQADAAGQRSLEAEALARTGRVLIDLGREREAEAVLREAHLVTQEIGIGAGEVLARLFLGTLLAEQGSPEGPGLVGRSLERATQLALPRLEAMARALQARVDLAAGALDHADQQSAQAVERLRRTGAETADRVVVSGTRALILASLGRSEEARRARRHAERAVRRAVSRVRGRDAEGLEQALQRLAASALDPEGPLYPRVPRRGGSASQPS